MESNCILPHSLLHLWIVLWGFLLEGCWLIEKGLVVVVFVAKEGSIIQLEVVLACGESMLVV